MQRKGKRRNVVLLVLLFARPCHAFLCDILVENTWWGLRETIETYAAGRFLIICPFHIKGDSCPPVNEAGYTVPNGADLYLMCDAFYDSPLTWNARDQTDTGCIIDCPGVHFKVGTNASLTLDSMTLKGSIRTAVIVEESASLTIFNSHFEANKNEASNGGAIFLPEGSDVYISQTSFASNSARNGGAIYSLGHAEVHDSQFLGNVAVSRAVDSGGGALCAGSSSAAYVTKSYFAHNSAHDFGPAILDQTDGGYTAQSNTGCNNTAQSLGMKCNGALQVLRGIDVCVPFEEICDLPTGAPTHNPTATLAVGAGWSETWSSTPKPSTSLPSSEPTVQPTQYGSSFDASHSTVVSTQSPSTMLPPQEPSLESDWHGEQISTSWTQPTHHIRPTSPQAEAGSVVDGETTFAPSSASVVLSSSSTPTTQASQEGREQQVEATYDASTGSPTEASTFIQTSESHAPLQSVEESSAPSTGDVTSVFESLSFTGSPTLLGTSGPPLMPEIGFDDHLEDEDDYRPPVDTSTPLSTHNEVGGQSNGCNPLVNLEVLQSTGSYIQGSMKQAVAELTPFEEGCAAGINSGGRGRLYYIVGTGAVMAAHTCSFFFESFNSDTQLSIYTSKNLESDIPCARDLVCVASNDDFCGNQSLVKWYAEEGRGYLIQVQIRGSTYPGLHHHFSLTLSPTPGGSCQSAISITPSPLTGEFEIADDPSSMDLFGVSGFAWFLVTEANFAWTIASTCQDNILMTTRVEVFRGECKAGLQRVDLIEKGCDSGKIVSWLSMPGETYYIRVFKVDNA